MLTFEVPLVRVRLGKCVGFSEKEKEPPPPRPARVNSAAKDLAMGHRIVRAVESGEMRDYSEAARRLGVSQARVSMLVAITFLAPDIQEAILLTDLKLRGFNIHHLLIPARFPRWEEQRRFMRPTLSTVHKQRHPTDIGSIKSLSKG